MQLSQEAVFRGFLTQKSLLLNHCTFMGSVFAQGFYFRAFNLNGTTNFRGFAPFMDLPLSISTLKVVTFK